jgi:hypothetical protein
MLACLLVQEIPELAGVPAYWVNSAACVDVASNKITHKLAHGELIETEPWLKDGPITIGTALHHPNLQDLIPAVAFYIRLALVIPSD